jgi:hypothetical protein
MRVMTDELESVYKQAVVLYFKRVLRIFLQEQSLVCKVTQKSVNLSVNCKWPLHQTARRDIGEGQ